MSATGIESVLTRAMSDSAFADQLFANPEQALTGFELTSEEVSKFKNMSRAEFDSLAIEDRKSMTRMSLPDEDPEDPTNTTRNHNQTSLHIHN